jgi:hypothetical protein
MTRNTTRFLLPAFLSFALAGTAAAAPDGTMMDLEIMKQGDDMVAVVTLEHLMGAPLELDLTYNVNGVNVKTEPVLVLGPTTFVEILGPADAYYGVCAGIEGLIHINGDLTRPTAGATCDLHFPAPEMSLLLNELSSRGRDLTAPGARTIRPVDARRRPLATLQRR